MKRYKAMSVVLVWGVLLGWSLAPAIGAGSGSMKHKMTHKEKDSGWVSLFDGKTTKGWRGFRSETFPKKGWEVVDGALHHIARAGGGDIINEKQYDDFDFTFEWKVAPGANSGVFFRVSEDYTPTYKTGIEYQILDDARHHDGKNPLTSAASNYALYPRTDGTLKPVGEYNTGRILAKGNHVEHWLNGKKVVEYEIGSEDWNKRIAQSKFAGWEHFGKMRKGYIGLQDHGNDVWFRNLKIRPLSK